jgi:hypothetical protein
MRERNFARPVDLGICMGASFNSLITERDAAKTFDAIGAVLERGGVFLLELHDPRTTYGKDLTAHWTVDTATARVHGLFKMVPRAAGHYRWDIAVNLRGSSRHSGARNRRPHASGAPSECRAVDDVEIEGI